MFPRNVRIGRGSCLTLGVRGSRLLGQWPVTCNLLVWLSVTVCASTANGCGHGATVPCRSGVPDVRSEQFVREAVRQAALIAQVDRHTDDQDFVEAVSVDWDEE